jgi:DNA-binding XRE family transcriptional regulator
LALTGSEGREAMGYDHGYDGEVFYLGLALEDGEGRLGQTIRELRKRRKLSQTELAEGAGVSLMTISRIERGEHDPHIKTLARIAGALGLSVLDVLRSAGYAEDEDSEG